MARWDMVYNVVREAARDVMHWGDAVRSYRYGDGGTGGARSSIVEATLAGSAAAVGADLLVACDGRYSAVRQHMEGGALPPPEFGVVVAFRAAIDEARLPAELRGLIHDHMRVYNTPDVRCVAPGGRHAALAGDAPFVEYSMRGLVRVGVMNIAGGKVHGQAAGAEMYLRFTVSLPDPVGHAF